MPSLIQYVSYLFDSKIVDDLILDIPFGTFMDSQK